MKYFEKFAATNYLVEVSWEVCNPIGGIYTVIQSKLKNMIEVWLDHYLLIGPYIEHQAASCFEELAEHEIPDTPIGRTAKKLKAKGYDIHIGLWLVKGKPLVILVNPYSLFNKLGLIKYYLWESHHIPTDIADGILNETLAFGDFIKEFFHLFVREKERYAQIIAHFHEWMASSAIPDIRKDNLPVAVVFTTHATLLARYLAMNNDCFYDHLPFFSWENEARHFNIEAQVKIERAAAHGSHVFTTVSWVTAKECEYLLGRKPDMILPNGINIEKFTALHEFQNLHLKYKLKIHEFVAGHFFQNYTFDLDNTLYFFTSGRYEFKNKGFDITLEALRRLNERMKAEKINKTVIMFFITKRPTKGVIGKVLQKRAVMAEIQRNCSEIIGNVEEKLFHAVVSSDKHTLPSLNEFVDEHLELRLRNILQSWRTSELPPVVTHVLDRDPHDDILNFIRYHNMLNYAEDKVKIVYHPDFISPSSPLLPLDYSQFVRGCHLGIFASYYEPWGYTPLECIASGIPTVTTDLAGFGDYIIKHEKKNVFVLKRAKRGFNEIAEDLASYLLSFVKLTRRNRISQRNKVEISATAFDWEKLRKHYDESHILAFSRCFLESRESKIDENFVVTDESGETPSISREQKMDEGQPQRTGTIS
ncbi:MAG: glycosyltransferase [Oligoflexales bacterium]|nr:glycosyltransferase [Oligoflexales bacterium]